MLLSLRRLSLWRSLDRLEAQIFNMSSAQAAARRWSGADHVENWTMCPYSFIFLVLGQNIKELFFALIVGKLLAISQGLRVPDRGLWDKKCGRAAAS
jgi:hypothetical protein